MVIVQANAIVGTTALPWIDIPCSWVDFVVDADRPFALKPLFTRAPRHIGPVDMALADSQTPTHSPK